MPTLAEACGPAVAFTYRSIDQLMSFLKQYNKGGRTLRTEVCVNDPQDFRIGRSQVHLGADHALAYLNTDFDQLAELSGLRLAA
jgi:hypothetical protein